MIRAPFHGPGARPNFGGFPRIRRIDVWRISCWKLNPMKCAILSPAWFICLLGFTMAAQAQVVISEFMANNHKTLADQDGEFSDWIEIHNNGATSVNLSGWSLTDSPNQLAKWRFPNVTLGPGSDLIVFASGKDRAVAGAQLHSNFSLDAAGEYLALVMPDGVTIASQFSPTYPEQIADVSYGEFQGANYYFTKPTPGAANGGAGFIAVVADTKFSQDRGFYDTPFDLTIRTETTGTEIRYTTNGIPPTATSGLVYTSPIRISGTTVLRAGAFKTGYLPSNIDTQTYIFLDDVIHQAPDGQPPPGWPTSWGNNVRDYGMDPDVVNNATYKGTIKNDLKTLPSFSIVMDLNDLFNSTRGIYANPGQQGIAWERPASVELIYPEGKTGFQINAGLRIRGGFSRATSNPKHAFRLFFREEYGAPKLKFPMFGQDAADTFDGFDLRTFQNYSWSFQGDSRGVFFRDQSSRDAQLAMGEPAERGDYYHLYINGQYWGLYNTDERPEASYAETYFGGNKEDYDVIKVEAGPYSVTATDGNMNAWTRLYNMAKAGFDTDEAYQKAQGNNSDGTRNPAYEVLLDVPNLIDYMLVIIYGGNLDAPISNFLGNTRPNNWYGIRNRNGQEGFRFFSHDAEHTLLNVNEDRTGPYPAGDTSVIYSSPQYLWKRLQANAEFRLKVADHIQRHFFNGGALTTDAVKARILKRKAEIDRAVVGESARWGDAKRATPLTRTDWLTTVNDIVNNYVPQRTAIVVNQLRADGFSSSVAAPSFSQQGGNINRGFNLSLSGPSGTIYYTRDGSDPRLLGGAVASSAKVYSGTLTLNESAGIKARVLSNGVWSALNEASFTVIQTFTALAVSEIMYNPPTQDSVDGDEFEFIELKNNSSLEMDLSGVHFTTGIVFSFPLGSKLGAGQFAVLASNPVQFQKKYPGGPITGTYMGRLSDGGETITLVHATGTTITTVAYGDQAPWPTTPDGGGFSLVPRNSNLSLDPADPANWRASTRIGGSPGSDDPPPNISVVLVNEILAHTDPPDKDAVELYNPNSTSADIGNWFITDDRATPKKFLIPAGTTIPPHGYIVFTEDQFNRNPGVDPSFNFSSHGEEVFVFSADAAGNLTGYSDGFSFDASPNGVSFGRYTNSVGEIRFPLQLAKTLGSANAGPIVGPVVINEISYHPSPNGDEFVELKNITGSAVKLYDAAHLTNTWAIKGLEFNFPANTEIPANGLALVVATDPNTFRSKYGVPSAVPIFGPFAGTLQDSGELLQLQRPDEPDVSTNGVVLVPFLEVDNVRYNDKSPWPTNAAGFGASLERINAKSYGDDPANWRASFGAPSPGLDNGGNRSPQVNAGADQIADTVTFPYTINLTGTASDDGNPNPPGALAIGWSLVGGPSSVTFANPNQLATTASFPTVGSYRLRLTANDSALQASSELTVTIQRPPSQFTLIPAGSNWKYLDNGSDQGDAWHGPAFNDGSWRSGKAQLGYGDGDEATTLNGGPGTNRFITSYFRQTFTASKVSTITQLTLRLLRDDGAVVFLNDREVFRSNMPDGDITFQTYASTVVGNANETAFFEKAVDPSLLVEGNNIIAVEIHQANATSSDISFDLELGGLSVPKNQSPTASAGNDLTIAASTPASLNGSASDDGLPSPPSKLTVSWSKVSGPGNVTFANPNSAVTSATFDANGAYVLRLSASDGELSAQDDVSITVGDASMATWRAQHFTSAELTNPAISGDDADPDGDGHTNLQEYTAGTDPRDSKSVLKLEFIQKTASGTKLQFPAVTGKTYTVEFRDSLIGASWSKLSDFASPAANGQLEVTDPNASASGGRFYRVVTPRRP